MSGKALVSPSGKGLVSPSGKALVSSLLALCRSHVTLIMHSPTVNCGIYQGIPYVLPFVNYTCATACPGVSTGDPCCNFALTRPADPTFSAWVCDIFSCTDPSIVNFRIIVYCGAFSMDKYFCGLPIVPFLASGYSDADLTLILGP